MSNVRAFKPHAALAAIEQARHSGDNAANEPPAGGGGVPPMDARIAKLEATLPTLATKEDLAREVGGLRGEFYKAMNDQTWKIITWTTGLGAALVAITFFIARNVT